MEYHLQVDQEEAARHCVKDKFQRLDLWWIQLVEEVEEILS